MTVGCIFTDVILSGTSVGELSWTVAMRRRRSDAAESAWSDKTVPQPGLDSQGICRITGYMLMCIFIYTFDSDIDSTLICRVAM